MRATPRPRGGPPARWPRIQTVAGRRRLLALAVIGGALLVGYIVTMILFPAPLVGRDTPVARVIGLPAAEAEERLTEQGFRPRGESRETDPVVPVDHVIWQDPPAGVELSAGAQVRLVVSDGPASVQVPDVAEFDLDQAVRVLAAGGLRLGNVDSVTAAQPVGVVVSTRPTIGSSVPSGSAVDMVISRGPATVRVPGLVGLELGPARALIEAAGLRVGTVQTRAARRERPGVVLEQRPVAGTMISRQARVNLLIAEPEGP